MVSPWVAQISGSWQLGLGLWAVPAFLALACWAWKRAPSPRSAAQDATVPANRPVRAATTQTAGTAAVDARRTRDTPIRPPYRAPRAWLLALYFGALNGGYASMVAWLPVFYVQRGWSIQQGGWLLGLMTALQVVAALVLPGLARRSTDRRPWLGVGLAAQLLGFAGLAASPDTGAVFWVAILGFGLGGSFALCMILALDHLDDPWRAGRLAAFMQAIGFMIAALAPMLSGWVRDVTGGFRAAWAIQAIIILLLLGVTLVFRPSGYARAMQGPASP